MAAIRERSAPAKDVQEANRRKRPRQPKDPV
jgi:hypothetical protein